VTNLIWEDCFLYARSFAARAGGSLRTYNSALQPRRQQCSIRGPNRDDPILVSLAQWPASTLGAIVSMDLFEDQNLRSCSWNLKALIITYVKL
jgi:hypothetical protein